MMLIQLYRKICTSATADNRLILSVEVMKASAVHLLRMTSHSPFMSQRHNKSNTRVCVCVLRSRKSVKTMPMKTQHGTVSLGSHRAVEKSGVTHRHTL